MKRLLLSCLICLMAACVWAQSIQVTSKGTIDPKKYKSGATATVSISRMPTTLTEFQELQQQLGKTPEGSVMLVLAAFEMYHQNPKLGEVCIRLSNIDNNHYSVLSRIKEVYRQGDSYARPHLVATFFEGAKPENGFNPTAPYTIKVRVSKTRDYERSEMLKGYVLHLEVYSEGYDTSWRGCDVIQQKGSEFFQVSNNPSMYVQCKDVPFDAPDYKGLK